MKKFLIIITSICIAGLSIPFVSMIFRPTTETTDNRKLAEFPNIAKPDGSLNGEFFSGFESWFADHFAFRNELIYADARIQNDVFKVSNVEGVISGNDGWMFYKSTLNDYLGTQRLSAREIYNIAHNLSLANDYVKENGSRLLVTAPANKNTLYGKYMPYYDSYKVDETHNMDLLGPMLKEMGVPYADLINEFKGEEDVLYLKTDSHWSNKGAVLAYNFLMDSLGLEHDDYSNVEVKKERREQGDLSKMMYTFYGAREENYYYNIPQSFEYVGEGNDVEDMRLETKSNGLNGSLLMFRDSFGNTLIPIIANQFKECRFTKETAYSLEKQMESGNQDIVIFEKAERNVGQFMEMPPVIPAPLYDGQDAAALKNTEIKEKLETKTLIKSLNLDYNYFEISGEIEQGLPDTKSDILVQVNDTIYKAYHTGEKSFVIYLKKDNVSFPAEVKVFVSGPSTYPVDVKTFNIEDTE